MVNILRQQDLSREISANPSYNNSQQSEDDFEAMNRGDDLDAHERYLHSNMQASGISNLSSPSNGGALSRAAMMDPNVSGHHQIPQSQIRVDLEGQFGGQGMMRPHQGNGLQPPPGMGVGNHHLINSNGDLMQGVAGGGNDHILGQINTGSMHRRDHPETGQANHSNENISNFNKSPNNHANNNGANSNAGGGSSNNIPSSQAATYSNNPRYLEVTQQPNLSGVYLDCDPKSLVLPENTSVIELNKGKVVSAVKDISEDGMCIWAGGNKELMLAIKNMRPIVSVSRNESQCVITQIVRIKKILLLITDKAKVLMMSLGGDLLREMNMIDLFFITESVSCHLVYEDQTVILGTTSGRLIVTAYSDEDKSFSVSYKGQDHNKGVTSFLWHRKSKREFLSSSHDRHINKVRLTEDSKLEVFMRFKYDESVLSMVKLHDFILIGLSNLRVAIVEPSRGNIIIAMIPKGSGRNDNNFGDGQGSGYKKHRKSGISSIAYFFKTSKEGIEKIKTQAFYDRKVFEEYLSKLRVLGLDEEGKLHIIGYPKDNDDNQCINLFKDKPLSKNTHSLPLILEKLSSSRLRIRVLGSKWSHSNDEGPSWMSQVEIQLNGRFPNRGAKNFRAGSIPVMNQGDPSMNDSGADERMVGGGGGSSQQLGGGGDQGGYRPSYRRRGNNHRNNHNGSPRARGGKYFSNGNDYY